MKGQSATTRPTALIKIASLLTCALSASSLVTAHGQNTFSSSSTAQPAPIHVHSPIHVHWDGVIGEDKNTPNELYCLMGSGFIMAPTSRNINGLIASWLTKHPHATTVRVATSGPLMVDQPASIQTYVWVVDGQTTLNEYLVRRGACPGGTMQIPDFSSLAPTSGKTGGAPFHFKIYVSMQQYNPFLKKIEQAEAKAQKEKLGIWKNGTGNVY